MQLSIFSSEEHPVSPSVSQDSAKGLRTQEATSCSRFLESLTVTDLGTLSGKTSPVSCHLTEERILVPFSGRWGSWGTGGPTGCWTLSGSEWPKDVAVCSLSDVLETSEVPQRFFLSPKACQGILRRAKKRGKLLPTQLEHALRMVAMKEEMEQATFKQHGGTGETQQEP
jgi:hypothetical protein